MNDFQGIAVLGLDRKQMAWADKKTGPASFLLTLLCSFFHLSFLSSFFPSFFISQVSISSIFTFTSFASFSMYLKFTKEYINRVWGRIPRLYDSTWLCCLRPKPSLAYFTVPCRLGSDLFCVQMSHKTPAAKKVIRS